jgi:hypothetical protein
LQFCYKAREFNNCINFKKQKKSLSSPSGFYIHERLSIRERPRQELCIALTDHFFCAWFFTTTEGKNLFNFGAKKDLEDLSAYAGDVAE